MHIEPGFIAQSKILLANVAAGGVLLGYAGQLVNRPADILRTALAAIFFTLFMESFHVSVGPSELHFVGAMAIYLTLGFIPTLMGFAAGLLLQGLIFNPADLVHLSVNSLSLILPLIAVHYGIGRKLREDQELGFKAILKLDAAYYTGVTAMVGFWLATGETSTPFSAWAAFAASYLSVVAIEPVFTYATVRLLKKHQHKSWIHTCFAIAELKTAK